MSKEMLVIALGLWVAVIPQLGVYDSWRSILVMLSGVAIAIIGFLLRGEVISRGVGGAETRVPRRNEGDENSVELPQERDTEF